MPTNLQTHTTEFTKQLQELVTIITDKKCTDTSEEALRNIINQHGTDFIKACLNYFGIYLDKPYTNMDALNILNDVFKNEDSLHSTQVLFVNKKAYAALDKQEQEPIVPEEVVGDGYKTP